MCRNPASLAGGGVPTAGKHSTKSLTLHCGDGETSRKKTLQSRGNRGVLSHPIEPGLVLQHRQGLVEMKARAHFTVQKTLARVIRERADVILEARQGNEVASSTSTAKATGVAQPLTHFSGSAARSTPSASTSAPRTGRSNAASIMAVPRAALHWGISRDESIASAG
jgi:hypothetical protein